ncbi:unnamed protein product [Phaedon cochleariae]|uniref:UDP-glucuronosyltransferase n=1 Tax=Phaedon cochleariae TaxID=80249 RepID=A0A9P0DEZ6_PHACE|nr:unnamed protein product [Phaedon cochleariae]
MIQTLLFTIITINGVSESARILGVIPTPSYSHQIVFRPLWRELAKRGHDLVVITTDPENDPSSTIREIDVSSTYDTWQQMDFIKLMEEYKYNPLKLMNLVKEASFAACDKELAHPEIQVLLKNQSEHFDLVLVEYIHPIMLAFSVRFKCPYIGVASMELITFFHNIIGNPSHPVAFPDIFLPFEGKLNFWQRLSSSLFTMCMYLTSFIPLNEESLIEKHFGGGIPPMRDLMLNFSMMFVNVDPAFNLRPLGPAFVSIGGGMHLSPLKPLPQDLQEFMNGAERGVVYFSLGTNIKSNRLSPALRNVIMDTFRELPYRLLWKFDKVDFPDIPKNVKIMNWVPQQDILRHPKVKLFITQGGLQSIEEAIFSNVPLIGIPFVIDQDANVKKIVGEGCGLYLDKNTLTTKTFKAAILEVLNNPRYKKKITEIAELSQDQPMTGLQKAVWWTEYVLRHKGAHHFRNPIIDLPFYQYYLLDVMGFLVVIIFSFWLFFYWIANKTRTFIERWLGKLFVNKKNIKRKLN